MNREEYLNNKNYKLLHNFLSNSIYEIDIKSSEFLTSKSLNQYLIRKRMSCAPEIGSSALYSLTYTFFEELEEISFRENDVSIGFHCFLRNDDQFEIKGAMGSIYEEIDFHYNTTSELAPKEKETICKLSIGFIKLMSRFLDKELSYREKV